MSAWFPPPEEARALAEAVEILRRCEWVYQDRCPECFGDKPHGGDSDGHAPGCRLDAFLKRWGNGRP